MTKLPTDSPTVDAATAKTKAPSAEPSVLEVAEAREPFAPPVTTEEIADWVNEGGAGGEVRR
jgi:hypothetical protein